MEISGKILREVEFRDRLRGYDTDEVDEFLEKVAVAIDEMRSELVALRAQPARPAAVVEQRRPEPAPMPTVDDDSIRRTLVLAQRTADLAISEAREEAQHLVEDARSQAEGLVTQAQDAARHLKEEAEFEAHERVDRLTEQRDRLERDIQSLAQLLGTERDRLTQALQSALGFVAESLSVSDDLNRAVNNLPSTHEASAPAPVQPPQAPRPAPMHDSGPVVPDVETEIAEDATTALAGELHFVREPEQRHDNSDNGPTDASLDPDEALWARWAQGADVDFPNTDSGEDARQFNFPRGGDTA